MLIKQRRKLLQGFGNKDFFIGIKYKQSIVAVRFAAYNIVDTNHDDTLLCMQRNPLWQRVGAFDGFL